MEKIKFKLKEFFKTIVQKPIEDGRVDLIAAGILDSFTMIELVNFIEKKFKITVDMENLTPDNFNSLEKISAAIQKWLN